MRQVLHHLKTMTAALCAAVAICAVPGCGGDDPVSVPTPPAGGGTVTLSTATLAFEAVCTGQSRTLSFEIVAPESNAGSVSGEVSIEPGSAYAVTAGAGPYTLAPGETHHVEVTFAPVAEGTQRRRVQIGVDAKTVACDGFGSAYPFVSFRPTTLLTVNTALNYGGFDLKLTVPATGVSYSSPAWHSCTGSAWVFDGNPIAESWVEFELDVPAGTQSVLIDIGKDASGTCAQLLMEIDGNENTRTNFGTPCTTRSYRFAIAPGRRSIRIGTDQQGVACHADISVQHVTFTFEGHCLTEEEWAG